MARVILAATAGTRRVKEPIRSIAELIRERFESFSRAERRLADSLLDSYPVSGLGTITAIADNASVSTATVARLLQKIGFRGFPEFQSALRNELEAQFSNPIAKRDPWVGSAPDRHVLNQFPEAAIGNIEKTFAQIHPDTFDAVTRLLADARIKVYVVGGRITSTLADYLFVHLQMIREGVVRPQTISNSWPHYLLDVSKGDAIVVFDVRRYEVSTLRLAEMAYKKGARVILFTDQWQSPVHKFAEFCFSCRIVVPSAWDTAVPHLLLIETLIAALQETNWDTTKQRIEDLESMFDRTPFFRKPT